MKIETYDRGSMKWVDAVNDGRIYFSGPDGQRYRLEETTAGQLTLTAMDGGLAMQPHGFNLVSFKTCDP